MNLSDWPSKRAVGRVSVVDQLPPEVVEQLIAARRAGSHSVGAMIAWLKSEGHDTVSVSALTNWFQARGYRHGAGSGPA
jgi:phosphoserine phosphatase